ncbi:Flp pilus assembly complex ATPase component TadA, partial [Candidatus Marsarchaeota archaeon]|nr:Flp pilus assembly complex ATPase component TadA [Candidatus Marsarchaeota archaeon]
MNKRLADIELKVLDRLIGRFVKVTDADRRKEIVMATARTVEPGITADEVNQIFESMNTLYPIDKYATSDTIEDVMINNTKNIFVYDTDKGSVKTEDTIPDREALDLFVKKLRLYATNESAHGNVMDVHMPTGNRVNIVSSPLGYDITMRNFKKRTLSIIDLINSGELDYQIAARLWVYMDGFAVRPANLLIGGMPASGKTTLLNAMFSFIRPEERIVTIEETYELNTETQENCARLETSEQLPMEELVKNALRMRPDMIIIGETRGKEANDMITAMNIGKIVISTIHASTARDVINRLQHAPMNVPMEMISVVDGIIITAQVFKDRKPIRKVTQMSE